MQHSRKNRLKYFKLNAGDKKKSGCSLCNAVVTEKLVEETETMAVTYNRMPYNFFEGYKTTGDHYMVIPKQHRETLAEFTDREKREYFDLTAKYELAGYSIYSRGAGTLTRSQPHQHTHFIKLLPKRPRFFVYISKPYFVFHR